MLQMISLQAVMRFTEHEGVVIFKKYFPELMVCSKLVKPLKFFNENLSNQLIVRVVYNLIKFVIWETS